MFSSFLKSWRRSKSCSRADQRDQQPVSRRAFGALGGPGCWFLRLPVLEFFFRQRMGSRAKNTAAHRAPPRPEEMGTSRAPVLRGRSSVRSPSTGLALSPREICGRLMVSKCRSTGRLRLQVIRMGIGRRLRPRRLSRGFRIRPQVTVLRLMELRVMARRVGRERPMLLPERIPRLRPGMETSRVIARLRMVRIIGSTTKDARMTCRGSSI